MNPTASRQAYSYRCDQAVPDFHDDSPLVIMDGNCALCTGCAQLIARFDRSGEFRICRTQSPLGTALLRHYGLDPDDPDDPESWLLVADGRAYASLDGIVKAGARLGGVGWLLQPLRLLPRSAQDWLYRLIARNRYRIFGRADMCMVSNPALQARFLE